MVNMKQNTWKFHNYWPEEKRKNCHTSAWLTEKFGRKDFVAWWKSFLSYTALSVTEKKAYPTSLLSSSLPKQCLAKSGQHNWDVQNWENKWQKWILFQVQKKSSKLQSKKKKKKPKSEKQISTKKPKLCDCALHHHFLHSKPQTLLMDNFPAKRMVQLWNFCGWGHRDRVIKLLP